MSSVIGRIAFLSSSAAGDSSAPPVAVDLVVSSPNKAAIPRSLTSGCAVVGEQLRGGPRAAGLGLAWGPCPPEARTRGRCALRGAGQDLPVSSRSPLWSAPQYTRR